MDQNTVTVLVSVGEALWPEVEAFLKARNATITDVKDTLAQDAQQIQTDSDTLSQESKG